MADSRHEVLARLTRGGGYFFLQPVEICEPTYQGEHITLLLCPHGSTLAYVVIMRDGKIYEIAVTAETQQAFEQNVLPALRGVIEAGTQRDTAYALAMLEWQHEVFLADKGKELPAQPQPDKTAVRTAHDRVHNALLGFMQQYGRLLEEDEPAASDATDQQK